MSKNVKPKEVRSALRKLGNSSKQIAENLTFLRIKGSIEDPNFCPLANYLAEIFKEDSSAFYVNGPDIGYRIDEGDFCGDSAEWKFQTSKAVDKFVKDFDDGKYPELEIQ